MLQLQDVAAGTPGTKIDSHMPRFCSGRDLGTIPRIDRGKNATLVGGEFHGAPTSVAFF